MACAVGQLVEGGAVIFSGACELLTAGKGDPVSGGLIEGPVTVFVAQLYAASAEIINDDGIGGIVWDGGVGERCGMFGGQSFALVNVEHVIVTQEGDFLLFACFFVFLFNEFPENDHAGLFAFLHLAAFLLTLLEGDIFASPAKEHLVQEAVGLACGVADSFAAAYPRF